MPTWVLEAGFVGSSGINQTDYNHNYNAALLASPSNPINGITTNTVQNVAFRTPYLGYQPGGLLGPEFNGIYNYSSLAGNRAQADVSRLDAAGFLHLEQKPHRSRSLFGELQQP